MTKDEILSMAEKTQFHVIGARVLSPLIEGSDMLWLLERFADLVAEKERDACAKLAEQTPKMRAYGESMAVQDYIANAIRARGQK
jgi:hypothetical protein